MGSYVSVGGDRSVRRPSECECLFEPTKCIDEPVKAEESFTLTEKALKRLQGDEKPKRRKDAPTPPATLSGRKEQVAEKYVKKMARYQYAHAEKYGLTAKEFNRLVDSIDKRLSDRINAGRQERTDLIKCVTKHGLHDCNEAQRRFIQAVKDGRDIYVNINSNKKEEEYLVVN